MPAGSDEQLLRCGGGHEVFTQMLPVLHVCVNSIKAVGQHVGIAPLKRRHLRLHEFLRVVAVKCVRFAPAKASAREGPGGLHADEPDPNDPPMDHQGVSRLFKSTDAVRRAMAMADQSTHSGILFCVGTWAEMRGPEGRGEDVATALREFGRAGQVHQVHMRNITSPLPDFDETFPDGGYLDLFAIMDILVEIDFKGMIVPDHVPGDGDQIMMNEAYTLGYLRALIQYAQRCGQSRGAGSGH
jgi:hypothetical protein